MIRKEFLLKIFDAANMQRWNDKIRPVELRELDKQAHKMTIAYTLGKIAEEDKEKGLDWIEIIEGGIFEFLRRITITDLKPQILAKIKRDKEKYKQLNKWVLERIKPIIQPINNSFCEKFTNYFSSEKDSVNKQILRTAHYYATSWEFEIIERTNPDGYEISDIKKNFQRNREQKDCEWNFAKKLFLYSNIKNFVNLCGQLRFQVRWSNLYRIPRTSVLGHMLIVAMLSYLFSLEISCCKKRRINNYFNGLFHDLPEVLTRDIISPVKRSVEGLEDLIKDYEEEAMKEKIYPIIPEDWHAEMKDFTEREFKSFIYKNGKRKFVSSDKISEKYNDDQYNPKDGEIIKAVDELAAFMEAYLARKNVNESQILDEVVADFKSKYKNRSICGINFGQIYDYFT